METNRLPAGICPKDGVVVEDAVEWKFPNPARCAICGSKLNTAQMATSAEIANADREVTRHV